MVRRSGNQLRSGRGGNTGRSKRKKGDVEPFLEDLNEISRKHGVYIGGCGCCMSPYLLDRENYDTGGKFIAGDLEHGEEAYNVGLIDDYFE